MRVDAVKLLIIFYICSITVLSDAVKLFSRPPLTFEPGEADFKLLTAIRDNGRRTFGFYIKSLVAPRNDFRTISDCCCLPLGLVHTQQDSFYGYEKGTLIKSSKCAKTFEVEWLQKGIKYPGKWIWSFFGLTDFPLEGFATMVFLFLWMFVAIGANDVQFSGRYLCIWLEVNCGCNSWWMGKMLDRSCCWKIFEEIWIEFGGSYINYVMEFCFLNFSPFSMLYLIFWPPSLPFQVLRYLWKFL